MNVYSSYGKEIVIFETKVNCSKELGRLYFVNTC